MLCKHTTLYFASGGYYVCCGSCPMHWIAVKDDGAYNYAAGDHQLDGKDLRVETESVSVARARAGTG
jgi:hypothetical protein